MKKNCIKELLVLSSIGFSIYMYAGKTPPAVPAKSYKGNVNKINLGKPPIPAPRTNLPPIPAPRNVSTLSQAPSYQAPLPPRQNVSTSVTQSSFKMLLPKEIRDIKVPQAIDSGESANSIVKLRRQKALGLRPANRNKLPLDLLSSEAGQKAWTEGQKASTSSSSNPLQTPPRLNTLTLANLSIPNSMKNLGEQTESIRKLTNSQEERVTVDFRGKEVTYGKNYGRYSNVKSATKTDIGSKYATNANKLTRENVMPLVLAQFPQNGEMKNNIPNFFNMLKGEKINKVVVLVESHEMNDDKKTGFGIRNKDAQLSYFSPQSGTIKHINPNSGQSITVKSELISDNSLSNESNLNSIQEKKYKLTITEPNGESREIEVVHFDGWKDKTAVTAETLLSMVKKLDNNESTLIHCSAGVGRTGTLAAGKIMYDQYLNGQKVNVVDVIASIREERSPFAIQTKAQEELLIAFADTLNKLI